MLVLNKQLSTLVSIKISVFCYIRNEFINNNKARFNFMKNIYTKALAATALTSIILLAPTSSIFAADVNPSDFLKADYQYFQEDIDAVLAKRVGPNSIVSRPMNFKHAVDIQNVIYVAGQQLNNNIVLIPVNTGGHWVALALVKNANGHITAIYNDPMGTPLNARDHIAELIVALTALGENVTIRDLTTKLQHNGVACGAFTAETLAVLSKLDINALNQDEIKAAIAGIADDATLRRKHFIALYDGDEIFDVVELKPVAEKAAAEVTHQARQLRSNLSHVTSLTQTRISHLNRTSHFSGLASGDDIIRHGVWVKGFAGTETDKSKNSANDTVKTKGKTQGAIVGVDTKIAEDITVGIAYSHVNSSSKDSTAGKSSGKADITSDIVSIYASTDIDNDLSLDGTIAYGTTKVKNTNTSGATNTSTKIKGNLAGAALTANYNLRPSQNVLVTPRIGVAYNQLELKAHNDGFLKVAKLNQREIELNVGVVASYLFDMGGFNLIPEANVDYRHAVWRKGGAVKMTNKLGQVVLSKKNSDAKGSYHAGLGLTAMYNDSLELGGGYEYSKQGKAQGHMGYAKLRVNF